MKKILIVSSKWPLSNSTFDGGNITVKQIAECLKNLCIVDMLYFSDSEPSERYSSFRNVFTIQGNYDDYSLYSGKGNQKYLSRIVDSKITSKKIIELIGNYDKIIIVHCRFLFGLENISKTDLDKIILFPMFLTPSYKYSGEEVPSEYYEYEKNVLSKISKIITPSEAEKEQLLNNYRINKNYISVIPRITEDIRITVHKQIHKPLKLIYIAAFRKQKNNLAAMKIVYKLINSGIDVLLDCIGPIQDKKLFADCQEYTQKKNIEEKVKFKGVIKHDVLMSSLCDYDFNISVSAYETFGRGIVEGFSSGLPSIVLSNPQLIKKSLINFDSVLYAKNIDEMVSIINGIIDNMTLYEEISRKSIDEGKKFNSFDLKEKIKGTILG